MAPEPLISVITVTYNAENEISATLGSLKEQTFTGFEHIVVDGASTDATLSRVRDAAIPRSVILSEPDKGLYDAMNKGLRLAKGKYVIFLNAGDTFHNPETLQRYADAGMKDYDIIYGDTCIIDNTGNIIGRRHLNAPAHLDFKSFSKGMLVCHQAFMVKKSLTQDYNLNYRFSADFDWCINCIKKSRQQNCLNLNEVTIKFLEAGMSDKNKFRSLQERFRIMNRHYGLPTTLLNHFSFIFRALKRGKV